MRTEMERHHVWCNKGHGPISECTQCQDFFVRFPYPDPESGKGMMDYFPEATVVGEPMENESEEKPTQRDDTVQFLNETCYKDWVRCPICKEDDMPRYRPVDSDGQGAYIICLNLLCPSNVMDDAMNSSF